MIESDHYYYTTEFFELYRRLRRSGQLPSKFQILKRTVIKELIQEVFNELEKARLVKYIDVQSSNNRTIRHAKGSDILAYLYEHLKPGQSTKDKREKQQLSKVSQYRYNLATLSDDDRFPDGKVILIQPLNIKENEGCQRWLCEHPQTGKRHKVVLMNYEIKDSRPLEVAV